MAEKYTVQDYTVEHLLDCIKNNNIAIPEIQRPFVWKPKQVRDLVDSLYKGYPTGYIIISKSPVLKLKNGSNSLGMTIMIDGQQRVTAMMAALVGWKVLTSDFEQRYVKISYNPFAKNDDDFFAVQDSAILKDKKWIHDISEIFGLDFKYHKFLKNYCANNPDMNEDDFDDKLSQLIAMRNRKIGVIELFSDQLNVDEITEIFIRINSQGTKLNQADFAMSRIAANETYGGNMLRKAIDYFSHLAVDPKWYSDMTKDAEFAKTEFAQKLKWLKDDNEDIYNPDYSDMLRVAFMYKFSRGKMKDLVSLLQGRDFETKDFKESIAEDTFKRLSEGVLDYMNEYNFKQFTLAIKDAGFIAKKLINSDITLDFAYTLYLILSKDKRIDKTKIKFYVQRWYVLSTLTSRYISSPETKMDEDLRKIKDKGFENYLHEVESDVLSESFWSLGLVNNLETSSGNSPYISVFWASQVRNGDNSLFNDGTKVSNLITTMGDVHHIFPKQYLIKNGIKDKSKYNQVANYTYLNTTINIAVGDDAPKEYFGKVFEQCTTGNFTIGNLKTEVALLNNLEQNCIPNEVRDMTFKDYDDFLLQRRKLIAAKIKAYYAKL